MKIAVTDANIFIDLIEIESLQLLFDLGLEIHTTLSVYHQLNDEQKIFAEPFVHSKNLSLYPIAYEEWLEIEKIDFPPGLDPVDKTVYYYAEKAKAIILSGDKKLKTYCVNKKIEVHGILWLFDSFVEKQVISKRTAASKLQLLITINDRLPMDECIARIQKWSDE
jgi:predicted nucleic acid-binding protein